MARKHHPALGPTAKRVLTDIFESESIKEKVPGLSDVQEGAAHLRALHEEVGTLGRFQKASGFTPGREMQRVAKINAAIQLTLEQTHDATCDCGRSLWGRGGHKEWFYAWLQSEEGQEYDVRGKVAL